MKKNTIRLTEGQLHKVIKESVHKMMNELSIGTLTNARDKAQADMKGYGVKSIMPSQNPKDYPNWKPSEDFNKAIGMDSKMNYAKRMSSRRGEQVSNFSQEVTRRTNGVVATIYRNQAAFENACDCMYYGDGYSTWFKGLEGSVDENTAKLIWKMAHQFMAQDETNDWKDWIRGRYKDSMGFTHYGDGPDWDSVDFNV